MTAKQKEIMFFISLSFLVFVFVAAVPLSDPPYLLKLAFVYGAAGGIVMTLISGVFMLTDEFRRR